MNKIKVGLNGFGRIGRAFARIALSRGNFEIVAINTRKTTPDLLAYLLKYDSVYRTYSKTVTHDEQSITVDGQKIAATMIADPEQIDWSKYGVDVVVDATGAFTTKPDLEKHIRGSVKKVILTAPSKDEETPNIVLGVNHESINWQTETVISNASCTTNCAAPLYKVLDENFGIVSSMMTTVHALTMTQSMLDDPLKTKDRSRSAVLNIVPSTSGAAKAVVKTLPQLKGKIEVGAMRVPVPTGSLSDITAVVAKPVTVDALNAAFKTASETNLKGILGYSQEVLVSSDFIGSPFSCVFDTNYTKVIGENMVKVVGWYDNEWGYSTRLVDMVELIASKI